MSSPEMSRDEVNSEFADIISSEFGEKAIAKPAGERIVNSIEDMFEVFLKHGEFAKQEYENRNTEGITFATIGVYYTNPATGELIHDANKSLNIRMSPIDNGGYKHARIKVSRVGQNLESDEKIAGEMYVSYKPYSGEVDICDVDSDSYDALDILDLIKRTTQQVDSHFHKKRIE